MYFSIIENIVNKYKNNESIALDLISFFNNEDFEKEIIEMGDQLVKKSFDCALKTIERIYVVVSLTYIALKYYDNDLWTHIRNAYVLSYDGTYSDPKVDGRIRNIIQFFRKNANHSDPSSYIAVPLVAAEVTHHWLYDFFDFCFSIYEKNLLLKRQIGCDELEEEFYNTFRSLNINNSLNETDNLLNLGDQKTYKLSKYTQSALKNNEYAMGLAKIGANCVNYIVKLLNNEKFVIHPFYQEAFKLWKENNFKTKEAKMRLKNGDIGVWKITLEYKNYNIYLKTKTLKIDNSYDTNTIELQLLQDGKIVETDKNLSIDTHAISGYLVQSKKYDVGKYVLNKLSYRIVSSNEVLFDSKDVLFREICFFDEEGNEIYENKDYNGYMICASNYLVDEESYSHNIEEVYISTLLVEPNKVFYFNNKAYMFKSFKGIGIYGEKKDWLLIKKTSTNKYIDTYNQVHSIVVETVYSKDNFNVIMDGKILSKENYEIIHIDSLSNGIYQYKFIFNDLLLGYHNFSLYTVEGKLINKTNYSFIYSPCLEKSEEIIDSNKYAIHFNSSFGDKTLEYILDDNYVSYTQNIPGLGVCEILICPEIICFSFNRNNWFTHNSRVDYSNIKMSCDKLYIKGIFNDFIIKSINQIHSTSLQVEENNDCEFKNFSINIAYLSKIESLTNFETIRVNKDNIFCDLKIDFVVYVNMNNSTIEYDIKNNCTNIKFDFDKEKQLVLEVIEDDTNIVCYKGKIKGNEVLPISSLEPFRKYNIILKHQVSIFSFRKIEQIPYCFYDKKRLVNQVFIIEKVEIYDKDNNRIKLCNKHLNPTLKIHSIDKDNNLDYVGSLKKEIFTRRGYKNLYWDLGILKISTDGEFVDGKLWVYIYDRDDETLLYDENERKIHHSNDVNYETSKMLPINRYLISIK